jgi:hypothetical protein
VQISEIGTDYFMVTWKEPVDSVIDKINGYIIECKETNKRSWHKAEQVGICNNNSCRVSGSG